MSDLEQLLFERLQRWGKERADVARMDVSPALWRYYRSVMRRTTVAREDWQAAVERARAKTTP